MTFGGLDLGSWADWTGAIAALAGTVLSIFAIKFALAANVTAEKVRQETKEATEQSHAIERARDDFDRERDARDKARDARDRDRERRELAGSVAAWWVLLHSNGGEKYGVVVSNQSTTNAVFYDVEVGARCFSQSEQVIRMNVLPPGKYFVPQKKTEGKTQLERIPLTIQEGDFLEAFTAAKDRAIDWIRFSDGLGARWQWRSGEGLAEVHVEHERPAQ